MAIEQAFAGRVELDEMANVPEDECRTSAESQELARRVRNFLVHRSAWWPRLLTIEAAGGTVTITGRLPSAHDKWVCLGCCRRVAGVVRLVDAIDTEETAKGRSLRRRRPR